MTVSINFAQANAAFVTAIAAVSGLNAALVSEDKAERLNKILARIEKDAVLLGKVVTFKKAGGGVSGGLEDKVTVGAVVTFSYGRGDTARTLTGVVHAVRERAEGVAPAAKVQVGEGFDAELFTIHPAWVTAVAGVEASQEEEVSEADQLDVLEGDIQG